MGNMTNYTAVYEPCRYLRQEKKKWLLGPWQEEPDHVILVRAHFFGMVHRHPQHGMLAAWLGLPFQTPGTFDLYRWKSHGFTFADDPDAVRLLYGDPYMPPCTAGFFSWLCLVQIEPAVMPVLWQPFKDSEEGRHYRSVQDITAAWHAIINHLTGSL